MRFIRSILFAATLVLAAAWTTPAQYKGNPVKKDKLVSVLRSKQLQTREIVTVIKTNGVDFEVTPLVEAELTGAGARPEVIAAARANYRAPARPAGNNTAGSGGNSKFTGQPLSRDAIVTLLQNGVADAQVRKNVEQRGVSFKPTVADKTEIRKNGGSVALVNLIAASYVNPNETAGGSNNGGSTPSRPGQPAGDDYDSLVDKAVAQYDNEKDPAAAIATLQKAIGLDPSEARGYQLLGFTYLYGQKNFAEAERYMREAIMRGGSAVFRVFHDHDGMFAESCNGSLFIAKDTVRFESDDNKHTFETNDANIKQVKMNSVFKSFYKTKSGSFKIVLASGDSDSVKFSFAPLTDNSLESKMIIRLIGKDK
ncbi:MAG: tetratricopeptide repeat protein [Pyrinomonadaceae bacterium]